MNIILFSKLGRDKKKRLFIDQFCLYILNLFLSQEDFSKMNIEKSKIHPIDLKEKSFYNLDEVNEEMILYIIQPKKEIFADILESYFLISSKFQEIETNIIFIPGETYEIVEYMMANDLINRFKIYNCNIDLLPLDNDLLSLENENSFKEIYLENNLSSISQLVNAFIKIESCFGKAKHIYVKGDNSKIFKDLVEEKEKDNYIKNTDEILGMIVLDRSVDFLTTLTTNYTYEGLIDDFFGINFGSIKVKESTIKDNSKKLNIINNEKIVTYSLTSSNNDFYSKIGCMHYLDAHRFIMNTNDYYQKSLKNDKENGKISFEEIAKVANDLKNYVTEIKEPLYANKNIMYTIINNISEPNYLEYIKNEQILLSGDLPLNLPSFYEDYLCNKRDLNKIMKLICIECLTQGGIQNYNKMKREILNIYGYQNIFLFRNLEHIGLLKEKSNNKNIKDISYSEICEKLELIDIDFNEKKPLNCSYVMRGFCPINLRLIEKAIEGKWNIIQDIIKKMPGEVSFPEDESEINKPIKDINTIFLVFIGGITYTEIEGIRYLNRKLKESYDKSTKKKPTRIQLIIITTGILSSKKLFNNLGKDFNNFYSMKQYYEEIQNLKKK